MTDMSAPADPRDPRVVLARLAMDVPPALAEQLLTMLRAIIEQVKAEALIAEAEQAIAAARETL